MDSNNIVANNATLIGVDLDNNNEKVYVIIPAVLTSTPGRNVV